MKTPDYNDDIYLLNKLTNIAMSLYLHFDESAI